MPALIVPDALSAVVPESSDKGPRHRVIDWAVAKLPPLRANIGTDANLGTVLRELLENRPSGATLGVVGGASVGIGMGQLLAHPGVHALELDIALGPRTNVLCDAHRLPVKGNTLDAVVAQAVLGHLPRPWEAVAEIERVLAPGGLVYCEVAFMQPVCTGKCDYYRFTLEGLKSLLGEFEEIESGVIAGPLIGCARIIRTELRALAPFRGLVALATVASHLGTFWLKYIDALTYRRKGVSDAASALFFLGRKPANTRALKSECQAGLSDSMRRGASVLRAVGDCSQSVQGGTNSSVEQ